MFEKLKERTLDQNIAYILVGGSFIGLIASFILTLEKLALLKDASHQLSCSINPILSCGPIISSPQASLFGFPNPLIGLVGFSVVITLGMGLIAGAKYKRWFWQGLQLATLLAVVFVHWLIYQSLYVLNALCIYCMVVWSVTIPLFWYTKLYNLRKKHIATPKILKDFVTFEQKYHAEILISWYLLIIGAILIRFWDYWITLI